MNIHYTMIFVRDMPRSVRFYRDILGFTLKFESPHWTEFTSAGCTLALHLTDAASQGNRDDQAAGTCRPGFSVADLDAFHASMQAHGVPCVGPPKSVFGARVAQYRDPDGMVFSAGEGRGG